MWKENPPVCSKVGGSFDLLHSRRSELNRWWTRPSWSQIQYFILLIVPKHSINDVSIILQDLLHMIFMLSISTTSLHCLLEWSNMILLCFASPDPLETPARFEVAELCSLVKGKPTTSRILLTPQQGLMSHFSKGESHLKKHSSSSPRSSFTPPPPKSELRSPPTWKRRIPNRNSEHHNHFTNSMSKSWHPVLVGGLPAGPTRTLWSRKVSFQRSRWI